MPYYTNNPVSNARLSKAVQQYSDILTSNPQEEEQIEEISAVPHRTHKKHYLTELPTQTQTTDISQRTYLQITSNTSLSPSQISTLTDTVASKTRAEITRFKENIKKLTKESRSAAQTCNSIKTKMTTFVQSTKTNLDSIITRANQNIKKIEQSHLEAITKLQECWIIWSLPFPRNPRNCYFCNFRASIKD